MPTVPERLKDIRDEIASRLDLEAEQLQALASQAVMKISHQSGDWEAGKPVPSQGKEQWIVCAIFDHAPAEYEVGEQGDGYTFGEVRAYVLVPADVFGPLRQHIVAAGADMVCMVYRLMYNGQLIAKPKSEAAFTDDLCDEFEVLKGIAGLGGGDDDEDDTWRCTGCGLENPDTMEGEDDEEVKVTFCAKCGVSRSEVVAS